MVPEAEAPSRLPHSCFARPVPPRTHGHPQHPQTQPQHWWHNTATQHSSPSPDCCGCQGARDGSSLQQSEPFGTEHQHCSQEKKYSLSFPPTHTSPSTQGPKMLLLWGVLSQKERERKRKGKVEKQVPTNESHPYSQCWGANHTMLQNLVCHKDFASHQSSIKGFRLHWLLQAWTSPPMGAPDCSMSPTHPMQPQCSSSPGEMGSSLLISH